MRCVRAGGRRPAPTNGCRHWCCVSWRRACGPARAAADGAEGAGGGTAAADAATMAADVRRRLRDHRGHGRASAVVGGGGTGLRTGPGLAGRRPRPLRRAQRDGAAGVPAPAARRGPPDLRARPRAGTGAAGRRVSRPADAGRLPRRGSRPTSSAGDAGPPERRRRRGARPAGARRPTDRRTAPQAVIRRPLSSGKSSSQNSIGRRAGSARLSSPARSSTRRILPEMVLAGRRTPAGAHALYGATDFFW